MGDALGWRCKIGMLAVASDAVLQPECEAMRPVGVTNHIARVDLDLADDTSLARADLLLAGPELESALLRLMSPQPDRVVLADSRSIVDAAAARELRRRIETDLQRPCSTIMEALPAALRAVRCTGPIIVVTALGIEADAAIADLFDGADIEVLRIECGAPAPGGWRGASESGLRQHLRTLDDAEAAAMVLLGLPVSTGRLAAEAEHWLGKPVVSANTATYWHALREHGITDKVAGFGALLERL